MKPWSSSRPLTDNETAVINLIAFHRSLYGMTPTLREIADEIGAKDKTTAARILQTLRLRAQSAAT